MAPPYEIESRLRQDVADAERTMNRAVERYYQLRAELTAMLGTATFLFESCRTANHTPVCTGRYDGYSGTLVCSCSCHQTAA